MHHYQSIISTYINPPRLGGFQRVLAVLPLKSQQKIDCSLPHLATHDLHVLHVHHHHELPLSPLPACSRSRKVLLWWRANWVNLVVTGPWLCESVSVLIRIEQHCMALSNTETWASRQANGDACHVYDDFIDTYSQGCSLSFDSTMCIPRSRLI